MKVKIDKKIIYILVVLLLMTITIGIILVKSKENIEKEPKVVSIVLDHDLEITKIGSYSGTFMEDGSDEEVDDILFVIIKNNGNKSLQYGELSLKYNEIVAEFSFSTLLPGKEMLVLEKKRMTFVEEELKQAELSNVVFFEKPLSTCNNHVAIYAVDGVLNVENISQKDIKENITIYYKNKHNELYYGGITYRVIIEGGMEAGSMRQLMANHFLEETSEIMFVTCGS